MLATILWFSFVFLVPVHPSNYSIWFLYVSLVGIWKLHQSRPKNQICLQKKTLFLFFVWHSRQSYFLVLANKQNYGLIDQFTLMLCWLLAFHENLHLMFLSGVQTERWCVEKTTGPSKAFNSNLSINQTTVIKCWLVIFFDHWNIDTGVD